LLPLSIVSLCAISASLLLKAVILYIQPPHWPYSQWRHSQRLH